MITKPVYFIFGTVWINISVPIYDLKTQQRQWLVSLIFSASIEVSLLKEWGVNSQTFNSNGENVGNLDLWSMLLYQRSYDFVETQTL